MRTTWPRSSARFVGLPASARVDSNSTRTESCVAMGPDPEAQMQVDAPKAADHSGYQQIIRPSWGMQAGLKILCPTSAGGGNTQADSHVPRKLPGPFSRNSHAMGSLEMKLGDQTASTSNVRRVDFGGCGGSQLLAGEQVPRVSRRACGLESVFQSRSRFP